MRVAVAISVIFWVLAACAKYPSRSLSSVNTINVTGTFTGGKNASLRFLRPLIEWLSPNAMALNANDLTYAVVISQGGSCTSVRIDNGNFTVPMPIGTASGLVFASANQVPLGYVNLGNGGLSSFPLTTLAQGTNVIDLKTLSSNGTTVTPSNNPIGSSLNFSAADLSALVQANGAFSAEILNPDTDGDGIVDCLETRAYATHFSYEVHNGGNIGTASSATVSTSLTASPSLPANITGYHLIASIWGDAPSGTVKFTGPPTSDFSTATPATVDTSSPLTGSFGQSSDYNLYIQNPTKLPPAGNYLVQYGATTLTFPLPDQSNISNNMVLAVPTVTLDASGNVSALAWKYALANGQTGINPVAILNGASGLTASFNSTQTTGWAACAGVQGGEGPNRMWDANGMSLKSSSVLVPKGCQIPWSQVCFVLLSYQDIFGNKYTIRFYNGTNNSSPNSC